MSDFINTWGKDFLPGVWYERPPGSSRATDFWKKGEEEDWYYGVSIYKHSGKLAHPYPELTERIYVYPKVLVADIQWAEIADEALATCYIKRVKNGTVIEGFRL
jgi:hypothetical protein